MRDKYLTETIEEITKLIIGSLTFVSALAWNEAFKDYFSKNKFFKGKGLMVYAGLISLFSVTIIIIMNYVKSKLIKTMASLSVIIFFIIGLYITNKFVKDTLIPDKDKDKDIIIQSTVRQ